MNLMDSFGESITQLKVRGAMPLELHVLNARDFARAVGVEIQTEGYTLNTFMGLTVVEKSYMPPTQAIITDDKRRFIRIFDLS